MKGKRRNQSLLKKIYQKDTLNFGNYFTLPSRAMRYTSFALSTILHIHENPCWAGLPIIHPNKRRVCAVATKISGFLERK
jgi:hypothetical protein